MRSRRGPIRPLPSVFSGFRFPAEVTVLAVRWYLRYNLSYRDLEELPAERGITVDHGTLWRWVRRFTPVLADAAASLRHRVGKTWWVDETYVKVAGQQRYLYRAVDEAGQVIDVYLSDRRDGKAARLFFGRLLAAAGATSPVEVVTDRAHVYPDVVAAIGAFHNRRKYANNRLECDHGRLNARLRPMRGLKRHRPAEVVCRGHALVQNLRHGHSQLTVGISDRHLRLAAAFDELVDIL